MRHHPVVKRAGRLGAALAASAVAVVAIAPAAFADTSASKAQALNLSLVWNPVIATQPAQATNGGTPPATVSLGNTSSILSTQGVLAAGLLVQQAVAYPNGTSAACAGLVGPGGQIQIGSDGTCVFTGPSGGIQLNLPGALDIKASAILEECIARSDGTVTASAQLVDAAVYLLGGTTPILSLPLDPAASQPMKASVLYLALNQQTTPAPGAITGQALEVSVLNNVVDLKVGAVQCGPNAQTSPTAVFPVKSLPIVFGTSALFIAGGVVWWRRRSRRLASV